MKFAICNETFQNESLEEAFAIAKQCGFDGIEFAPFTLGDHPVTLSQASRHEIRQQLANHDLASIGLHWLLAKTEGYYLTSPDIAVRTRTAAYLADLAKLCRDLGGSIMVLGSPMQRNLLPGVDHQHGMEYAAEVIREALPSLEANDVILALEPLGPSEGNFLLTAEKGIELAQMVDSSHVKLHLDVKAMSSEAKPIPQIIHESAEYLVHFHANDPNKRGPGMGDVDFVPIFKALRDIDYQGWVSVEVFDYTPDAETIGRESITYMRKCLDAIGN